MRGRPRSKRPKAETWLRHYLSGGPRSTLEIRRVAAQQGYGWSLVNQCKAALGIESIRHGTSWQWQDPSVAVPEPVEPPKSTVEMFGKMLEKIEDLKTAPVDPEAIKKAESEKILQEMADAPTVITTDQLDLHRIARKMGQSVHGSLAEIETELFRMARQYPSVPPLSEDLTKKIALKYAHIWTLSIDEQNARISSATLAELDDRMRGDIRTRMFETSRTPELEDLLVRVRRRIAELKK